MLTIRDNTVPDHEVHEARLGVTEAVAELAVTLGAVCVRPGLGRGGQLAGDIVRVGEPAIWCVSLVNTVS